jgi:stage V sporulation protein AC
MKPIETKKDYQKLVEQKSPNSPIWLNILKAFIVGGIICCIGQLLFLLYQAAGMNELNARSLVSVTLIFIAVFLTGLHVFDDIAKFGGAGTLVPITGFANAVVSPAIDTKAEGWVLGVGAKLFTIAGPVILYGTLASTLYGVLYWAINTILK